MSQQITGSRPPAFFSETITPTRAMVVDATGAPIGLGTIRARHTLLGKLTGYYVEFDDGTRMTIAPSQIRSPENVVAPQFPRWVLRRFIRPSDTPRGAA